MPRILEVRGIIASNYVSEFHSKLKAFTSDSKWKTQPGASSSWKFLSSQTMGHSLTLTGVNKVNIFYQWDQFGKSPLQCERGLFPDLMSSTCRCDRPPSRRIMTQQDSLQAGFTNPKFTDHVCKLKGQTPT